MYNLSRCCHFLSFIAKYQLFWLAEGWTIFCKVNQQTWTNLVTKYSKFYLQMFRLNFCYSFESCLTHFPNSNKESNLQMFNSVISLNGFKLSTRKDQEWVWTPLSPMNVSLVPFSMTFFLLQKKPSKPRHQGHIPQRRSIHRERDMLQCTQWQRELDTENVSIFLTW